ncbi:hypothetical protein CLOSBL3_13118 [Clostridiaceae bacterium BL-3]|nr:hypothetical protein CLOSBL3_13118 [Clostridiaceae bacterium BL-3]
MNNIHHMSKRKCKSSRSIVKKLEIYKSIAAEKFKKYNI